MTEEQKEKTRKQIKELKVMLETTKTLINVLERMLKDQEENVQE